MEHIVDSPTVATRWAEQGEWQTARIASNNFSFARQTLFSYTTAIGHLFRHPKTGQQIALISTHNYSPTTSNRHYRERDRALYRKSIEVICTRTVEDSSIEALRMVSVQAERCVEEALRNLATLRADWHITHTFEAIADRFENDDKARDLLRALNVQPMRAADPVKKAEIAALRAAWVRGVRDFHERARVLASRWTTRRNEALEVAGLPAGDLLGTATNLRKTMRTDKGRRMAARLRARLRNGQQAALVAEILHWAATRTDVLYASRAWMRDTVTPITAALELVVDDLVVESTPAIQQLRDELAARAVAVEKPARSEAFSRAMHVAIDLHLRGAQCPPSMIDQIKRYIGAVRAMDCASFVVIRDGQPQQRFVCYPTDVLVYDGLADQLRPFTFPARSDHHVPQDRQSPQGQESRPPYPDALQAAELAEHACG